jgi:ATP phosphoribosyltransferase regulatory subunit
MFDNKKDNQVIRLPFGLRDILPLETEERNTIKEIIRREFKSWGYGEVNTPVIEYTKNISLGVGKNWKDRLINFFDIDGSPVSLRSDMTVPIARLTGMRIKKRQLPARFCYFADSYRQSGTQKGARRVYNQAGLELIGSSKNLQADIEILVILISILNKLNLRGYKIGLGHAEFIEGLCDWFRLDSGDREYVKKKVISKNLVNLENFLSKKDKRKAEIFIKLIQPEGSIDKVESLISDIEEGKVIKSYNYLKNIYDILGEFNYKKYLVTDFSIIRDFDYYTGLLFEVYCSRVTGVIGSGGRYDGLIKKFGMDVQATGFALDIDLAHKAADRQDGKENLKILLKGSSLKSNSEIAGLVEIAMKMQDSGAAVELCFEDRPNQENFTGEKRCDLIVEIKPDLREAAVSDLNKNTKKVKVIDDFIKEISNGKRD